jgi:penicillin-insensitive murein endopeptidase
MVRKLLFAVTIGTFLVSCGKPLGFHALPEEHDYLMADAPEPAPGTDTTDAPKSTDAPPPPGTVVRYSHRIKMKPTKWEDKKLTLTADVQINGKSYGDVEFSGTKKDSKVVLVPTNPELKDNLRAQLRCLSDDPNCPDYFIDVVSRDAGDVLYHDQVVQAPKTEVASYTPEVSSENPQTTPSPTPTQTTTKTPAPPVKENGVPTDQDEPAELLDLNNLDKSSFIGEKEDSVLRGLFDGVPTPPPIKEDIVPPASPTPTLPPDVKPPVKTLPADKTPPPGPKDPPSPPPKQSPPATNSGNTSDDHDQKIEKALAKFQQKDQAVNFPFTLVERDKNGHLIRKTNGRLDRAVDFSAVAKAIPEIGFAIGDTRDHTFGTYTLIHVLAELGQYVKDILPKHTLFMNSASSKTGGVQPPHAAHQNGTDMDIRYLRDNEKEPSDIVEGRRISKNFLVKEQWLLFKKAFETKNVEMIFVDRVVKSAICAEALRSRDYTRGADNTPAAEWLKHIQHWDGHENHFHIRVRCSDDDPRCRRVPYKKFDVGC